VAEETSLLACVNLRAMKRDLTPKRLRELTKRFEKEWRPGKVRGLLVAGSGLELEIPGWKEGETVDLGEALELPMFDLVGHRHSVTIWRRDSESLLVMNGRLHFYQGYSSAEVVAPVRMAALLGAEIMLATNATGALDPAVAPGSLVVISDHINMMGCNPLVGVWGCEMGPQFPDMSAAYDPELRQVAKDAAKEAGFPVYEGVYAGMLGPSFETPAEVRMLHRLGGTVVGMSTVPEVIAARHMGMRVLVLSLAANPGAGLVDRPLTVGEVLEAGREASGKLKRLMGMLVERFF